MDKERWIVVNRIFHAALGVDLSQRQALVLAQSNGDPEVESEVELLLRADHEAGSYLDVPLAPGSLIALEAPLVRSGEILGNRFRVVREIAAGGMGQVFEAIDTELAVRIALKVIRPEMASNPEAIARFRQEVRLARSITHPSICRTFDLERATLASGEVMFLTMEFLTGETMASRLQREGPLPLDEALVIARQIGGALEAAHALGIIHRDMKPANIMLVPIETSAGNRAVITDFGLARLDPLSQSNGHSISSRAGTLIGTLGYMAPEQLEGKPVSPATDIYAFALILFEMVTGERLFKSSNLLTGIAQRLSGAAPMLETYTANLPLEWRTAIEAGLRLNLTERPQTASEMLAILKGDQAVSASSPPPFLSVPRFASRKLTIIGALVLVGVVSLFTVGVRLWGWKADSKVAPGALIYLAEVQNLTGEKPLDTTTELLRASLAQSAQLNLLDQARIGDILQQMTKPADTTIDPRIAREIAMRAGAVRVVLPTVSVSNGRYSLAVDIQKPDSTPTRYRLHWTRSFTWNQENGASSTTISAELSSAVRDASDWIRQTSGESANDIARLDTPPEDVTTGSWQALQAYTEGERLAALQKRDESLAAFQKAAELDPHFSLAQARIGDMLVNLGRDQEGFGAYRAALTEGADERLSLRERDRIKGFYALDSWNFQGAIEAFRDYLLYYPSDYTAHNYLAYALVESGRAHEAIPILKTSYNADPKRALVAEHLALFELYLGNMEESRRWLAEMKANSTSAEVPFIEGLQFFYKGQYDRAEQAFRGMTEAHAWFMRALGHTMLTRLYAERGDVALALKETNSALDEATAAGSKARQSAALLDRAMLRCQTAQFDDCLQDVRAALVLDTAPRTYLRATSVLGHAAPHAGSSQAAHLRAELTLMANSFPQTENSSEYEAVRLHLNAEKKLASGDAEGALADFRKAATLESVMSSHDGIDRAAVVAASRQKDPAEAARLVNIGLDACRADLIRPGSTWKYSYFESPGHLVRRLRSFLRLAAQSGLKDDSVRLAKETLTKLRQGRSIDGPAD
jgi:serine/threonine protein kinase